MKHLFEASRLLLLDMASTFFFLALFLLTKNVPLSVGLGMVLGAAQIGWQFARNKPIDTMQWMSLFLVLGSGLATLITNDPRFVMIKPSMIYTIVGIVMLKPGNFSVITWASVMSIYAIVSKAALFMIAFATMRFIGVRRRRAQMMPAAIYTA